ncbi:myb family transcription factor APL isoform X2 [Olea europaea subsp. europaea]|nr:myb family transcription factor APL isoform X2 [Olea europaea subsp. europaea]
MRVMGVKGLTLYHLKSHLQKFRLGKQPHKEFNDHSLRDASSLELQRNNASSSGMMGRNMNEMQMEVNRRLHEQLEVQRHLQLRIEAQGKYMQTILEKACQTLACENMAASGNYKGMGNHQGVPEISGMKEFGPMNFPSLQDLNIYGGDQLELHQSMDRSSIDAFMPNNDTFLMGNKKRPIPYNNSNGKSPLIWSDDLRLQELGTAASSLGSQDDPFKGDHQIQIPPLSTDHRGNDIDSVSEIYETKPMLSGEVMGEKKFDAAAKLERPSPRRAAFSNERMNTVVSAGGMAHGRGSPFG